MGKTSKFNFTISIFDQGGNLITGADTPEAAVKEIQHRIKGGDTIRRAVLLPQTVAGQKMVSQIEPGADMLILDLHSFRPKPARAADSWDAQEANEGKNTPKTYLSHNVGRGYWSIIDHGLSAGRGTLSECMEALQRARITPPRIYWHGSDAGEWRPTADISDAELEVTQLPAGV